MTQARFLSLETSIQLELKGDQPRSLTVQTLSGSQYVLHNYRYDNGSVFEMDQVGNVLYGIPIGIGVDCLLCVVDNCSC